jgi:hypothetical protein
MPKALGRRMTNHLRKNLPLAVVATVATTVGWVAGSAVDPPTMVALAMVGIGVTGVGYFSLRPLLRPRHSHSSLPLFPVLVVA